MTLTKYVGKNVKINEKKVFFKNFPQVKRFKFVTLF